jgi:hypothetical protein
VSTEGSSRRAAWLPIQRTTIREWTASPGSGSWRLFARIAWGDREGIAVIKARALVPSDLWELSEDERNAVVVRESRSRGIEEVLADYRASFDDYVEAIEDLSEDVLNEPDRIRGLPERIPGWRPWRVLYDPDHYDDHGRAIASALEGRPKSPESRVQ